MRRLLITVERESTIEVDESKMEQVLTWLGVDEEPRPDNLERRIVKDMQQGEVSVDDIARIIGTDEGYDKYADTRAEVELQGKCEKHDWWYPLAPKRLAGCWMCINERREGKKK